MENTISFQFTFRIFYHGDFDTDSITSLLRIHPARTWKREAANTKPLYRDFSFWELKSEEIFSPFLEESIMEFLQPVERKISLISKLVNESGLHCKVFILVNIYSGTDLPAIFISERLLAVLAPIKCELDFDMYDNRKSGS